MRFFGWTAVAFLLAGFELPNTGPEKVSLREVAERAVAQSKLTAPGSSAFHLKARIVETTNPDSGYNADIEEYWASPNKWRRTIQSPDFSQTLIVNGDKLSEQNTGDYYPFWLNDLVTALFDPLPMLEQLTHLNAQIAGPRGMRNSTSCARFQSKVGIPPAENSAFSVFCFEGGQGLLESVVTPGYEAIFKDYRTFQGKRVAHRIVIDPEPGTTIAADITMLTELGSVEESLFSVQQSTPEKERLNTLRIDEAAARKLSLNTPDVRWPAVRSGKASGVLSVYISVDRNGQVREAWPLNSDNAGLNDTAREQVRAWQFRPPVVDGVKLQMETVLTFAFQSRIDNPLALLSDDEARKLATQRVEPVIPTGSMAGGTTLTVRVSVDENGAVIGVENLNNLSTSLFLAVNNAVVKWHFHPYKRDGKPEPFDAFLIFRVR